MRKTPGQLVIGVHYAVLVPENSFFIHSLHRPGIDASFLQVRDVNLALPLDIHGQEFSLPKSPD